MNHIKIPKKLKIHTFSKLENNNPNMIKNNVKQDKKISGEKGMKFIVK
jgi:hypothetical protein